MTAVQLTSFFPWTWIMHLARALVAFNIIHAMMKNKYNTGVTLAAVLIPCMLFSGISLQIPMDRTAEQIAALLYYVLVFVIVLLVTNGSIGMKLLTTILTYIAYISAGMAYSMSLGKLLNIDLNAMMSYEVPLAYLISVSLFVYAFSFVFVAIIRLIQSKRANNLTYDAKYIFFMFFPFTHIFSTFLAIEAYINIMYSDKKVTWLNEKTLETSFLLFSVICFLLDFFLILFVDRFEEIERDNVENQKLIMKNSLDYNQMQMMKQEKAEFRKIKHDYLNIITTAKGLIEIGNTDRAYKILDGANSNILGLAGFSVCSNETLNTVLYMKQQDAKKYGIKMIYNIEENHPVEINDYDLCRVSGNIIDNAINAVKDSEVEKEIKISILIDESKLQIVSENEYETDDKKKKPVSGDHGNGIGIVKSIAKRYGGNYTAQQNEGIWRSETVLNNTTPPPQKLREKASVA